MAVIDELINGQAADQISSRDRGVFYGDGVFETMAVVDDRVPLWEYHLARLRQGCDRLKLSCPPQTLLEDEIGRLIARGQRAILKLVLTAGVGGRGYARPDTMGATRILQRYAWPVLPRTNWDSGVRAIFCTQRLARQPALAGIKHLNRLEQVLARKEWQAPDIQEGILSDTEGDIIEAVSHNLFIVSENAVYTPDLSQCGVSGVMREVVMAWLRTRGVTVSVSRLARPDVLAADAVFLCNSIHGIWPICDLDGQSYPENRLVCELREAVAQMIPYP